MAVKEGHWEVVRVLLTESQINAEATNFKGWNPNKLIKNPEFTLVLVYHSRKPVFRPKMAIFRRTGIWEGGLPLPLAFQYLILMI